MENMQPACYQDLLDGKTLFQKMGQKFVEIEPGTGRRCSTIAGETFFMGWRWKDSSIGGSQGHLHLQRYSTATGYRMATQSEPRLYVIVALPGN